MTQTTTEQTAPQLRGSLMQMVFGYMSSQVLNVTASLGLADRLGDAAKTVDDLAAETNTDPTALYRLLRSLVCLGVVEDLGEQSFRLTDMGALLRGDHPDSARNVVQLFCGDLVWENWGHLADSVRTGQPVFELLGTEAPFELFAANPEFSAVFNEAMSEGTRQAVPGILATYDFSQFGTVVDLGGGDGTLLSMVLAATPGLQGILFDLPAGSEKAAARLAEHGVVDRCEVVAGDFFESVPDGVEAYMLKSVIHDWTDERCIAILRNCRKAMAPESKVVILEPMLPPRTEPTPEAWGAILVGDLNMLVSTGGRERTEAEFAAILAAADLRLTKALPVVGVGYYFTVIEAVPA